MQVQILEQTIFNFLILGKSRFPPKKFYNINYWCAQIDHLTISEKLPLLLIQKHRVREFDRRKRIIGHEFSSKMLTTLLPIEPYFCFCTIFLLALM